MQSVKYKAKNLKCSSIFLSIKKNIIPTSFLFFTICLFLQSVPFYKNIYFSSQSKLRLIPSLPPQKNSGMISLILGSIPIPSGV